MNTRYETYTEFVNKCEYIKKRFNRMTREEKRAYRQYIYQHNMKEYKSDRIWEYLNNDKDKFLLSLLKWRRKYD